MAAFVYMLIDANQFHHSPGPGANFASVRENLVRNNVFGPHGARHNTSFYSEVEAPRLGSSEDVMSTTCSSRPSATEPCAPSGSIQEA